MTAKKALTIKGAQYILEQRTELLGLLEAAYLGTCGATANRIFKAWKANYPVPPARLVDIGGGMGGVEVCLSKVWPDAEYWLVDRENSDGGRKVDFGEVKDFDGYNDIQLAKEFASGHGANFETVLIPLGRLPDKVDLVFSSCAWGFHFPVETEPYFTWSRDAARMLVIDCREGTFAFKSLSKKWDTVDLLMRYPKHEWYVCK